MITFKTRDAPIGAPVFLVRICLANGVFQK